MWGDSDAIGRVRVPGKDDAGVGGRNAKRGKDKADAAGSLGPVKVVSANFVRDKLKIDPETGKPVTKGYG